MTDDAEDPLRRRQYRNPPVIEGIARFQWAEPVPWSFTTPGLVFERLREVYPGEPQAMAQVSAGMFSDSDESKVPNAAFELRTGPQRVIYSNEDNSRRVGIGATDLSVHAMVPYEGWESMKDRLASAISNVAPVIGQATVSIVGLRYVNRVEIPSAKVDFEDYLTIGLGFPPAFPKTVSGFLDRVEMKYDNEDVTLAFTWASVPAPPRAAAFILDLDLYATCSEPVGLDRAFEVLQDLKLKEGRAFEALLQDRLRMEFDEIN